MSQVAFMPDGNATVRIDLTEPTATTSISNILKEITEIKAENKDLYEALARDDPNLIK
jgi:hypothetical protein